MATLEEYVDNLTKMTAKLAKATENVSSIHNVDKYPLLNGSVKQAQNILGVLGDWERRQKGLAGMFYDEWLDYFNGGEPGQIITGREAEDRTPVGVVNHPAPLDVTSWLYWTPLVAQGAELTYEAFKPATVSDEFMKSISIAETLANANSYINSAKEEEPRSPSQIGEPRIPTTYNYSLSFGYGTADKSEKRKRTTKSRGTTKYRGKLRGKTTKDEEKYFSVNIENINSLYTPFEIIKKEKPKDIRNKTRGYIL